jgi:Flp pilus assembly protein TadD
VDLVNLGRVDARTSALLIAGGGRGTADGAVAWDLVGGEAGGRFTIRFVAEVSGVDLLRESPQGSIPVASAAYVLDRDGVLVSFMSRGAVLSAEDRDEVRRVGWRWIDGIDLDPGDYSVRLMVRNHRTGVVFLDRFEVGLGEAGSVQRSVLPPVASAPGEGWVHAIAEGIRADGAPAARPVLVNGQTTSLRVGLLGPAASWADLRARVVDMAGRVVAEPTLSPAQPSGSPYRDFTMGAIVVPVGRYRLVIRAPEVDGVGAAWASLEALVVDAPTTAAWPAAVVDATDAAPADEAGDRLRTRDIRRAYRSALGAMARGEKVLAMQQLADLEHRVVATERATTIASLGGVQESVAAGLTRDNPKALWPVLWLHRSMNRHYRVRNESVLATHSAEIATELAGRLAARGDRDDLEFATDVLTEQANELVLVPAMHAAIRMLERALQLNPDHVDALVALGAVLERQGEIVNAGTMFERATRLDPNRYEAALRLAVTLDRAGQDSRARGIYRDLFDGAGPQWVRMIAVQQLASGLVADREAGDAVRILRRALEELGPNPRLTIQLAQALDDAGEPRLAAEMLTTLEANLDGDRSPRLRYSEWPDLGPRVDHQRLAERAHSALPALEAALGARSDEEG